MSLFNFAKQFGEKLFGSEEEAPAKIQERIAKNNPGLEDIQVKVENGKATISGKAKDAESAEKAVLIAGNVQGVEAVESQIEAPAEEASKQQASSEFYEIQSGDSLSKIAKKYYGDASKYTEIFAANKEVILDPDKIYPGQQIRIPSQQA